MRVSPTVKVSFSVAEARHSVVELFLGCSGAAAHMRGPLPASLPCLPLSYAAATPTQLGERRRRGRARVAQGSRREDRGG